MASLWHSMHMRTSRWEGPNPPPPLFSTVCLLPLQANAELAVREMLVAFSQEQGLPEVGQSCWEHCAALCVALLPCCAMPCHSRAMPCHAMPCRARSHVQVGTVTTRDQMDDGTPICLSVTIDRRDGSATFDFEGAALVVLGFVVVVRDAGSGIGNVAGPEARAGEPVM